MFIFAEGHHSLIAFFSPQMHTNTRPVPKGTPTCPTPKACRKVMGATLYLPLEDEDSPTERAVHRQSRMLYVPLDQQVMSHAGSRCRAGLKTACAHMLFRTRFSCFARVCASFCLRLCLP